MFRKSLVINDSYFLTNTIFGSLRSDNVDVIQIKAVNRKNKNPIIRLLSQYVIKRLFPWCMIFIFSILRIFFKKKNQYELVLTVGVEDLSSLYLLYKEYYNAEKLFYWQWNSSPKNSLKKIDFSLRMKLIKLAGFTVYTFDQKDAVKYRLKFHPQIYSADLLKCVDEQIIEHNDIVFFVGENKGRIEKIEFIAKLMIKSDLIPKFYIFNNNAGFSPCFYDYGIYTIDAHMEYESYLKKLNKSTFLLEVTQSGQNGLTLRALESIFFQKKLITDNRSIYGYDFYNASNIYVIDYDKDKDVIQNEIANFKRKPYKSIDKEILRKYDVKSFFKHIKNLKKLTAKN